jgi:hypothetical protein
MAAAKTKIGFAVNYATIVPRKKLFKNNKFRFPDA